MDNNKRDGGPVSVGEEVKKLMARLEKERAEGVGTPAPYRIMKMIEAFMPGVRENVRSNKMLAPVAFVFSGDKWDPVIMDHTDDNAKDFSVAMLRRFCQERNADCVITITEAWSLSNEDAHEYMKQRQRGERTGSISEHPRKKEIISFTVETNDGNYYGGVADILPGREISTPDIIKLDSMGGRMAGILSHRTMQ